MIKVEALTKSYASVRALRGISFEVEEGTVTGFLGPNGAGKTTTLRILSGFMPATEGRVEVAGHDVVEASREVRRRVGYLPEDVPLYRDMTVQDFLGYMAGLKEIAPGEVASEVRRVMSSTGLGTMKNRLIGKCSKGYRQRTGLAMALLGNPPVLLLDEPTGGLDPNQVTEVRDLIRRLSGEKTVLLSTHILSEVSQICGRVVIVHEGNLVASGSPDELAHRFDLAARIRLRADTEQSVLEAVPGVIRVRPDDGDWDIEVEDPDTTAPRLARAVMEAGGTLRELRHEIADLETVFRKVTRGGQESA